MLAKQNINFPPRPASAIFIPKNPEIPQLTDYISEPPAEWWNFWPRTDMPSTPQSRVNADFLEYMANKLNIKRRDILDNVISNLRQGADILCKGPGRTISKCKPAKSATEAGFAFSDVVVSWVKGKYVSGPHTSPPPPHGEPKVVISHGDSQAGLINQACNKLQHA